MSFWDNYSRLCLEHGTTPNGLAKELGLASSASVSGWKNGSAPRIGVLRALSDYFSVPIEELTADRKKPEPSGFWEHFVDLCSSKGLSPNAAAKELGISSGAVTLWKKGSIPQPVTLRKIADYFEVEPEYLIKENKKEAPAVSGRDLDLDLVNALASLTPEEEQRVRDFVAGLKAARGD